MGIGGLHIWHLLIIAVICVVIFGTKRLKDVGGDLGGAIKGFRQAMADADEPVGSRRQLGNTNPDSPTNVAQENGNSDPAKPASR